MRIFRSHVFFFLCCFFGVILVDGKRRICSIYGWFPVQCIFSLQCKLIQSYESNLVIYYCEVLVRVFSDNDKLLRRVKNLNVREKVSNRNWLLNASAY